MRDSDKLGIVSNVWNKREKKWYTSARHLTVIFHTTVKRISRDNISIESLCKHPVSRQRMHQRQHIMVSEGSTSMTLLVETMVVETAYQQRQRPNIKTST